MTDDATNQSGLIAKRDELLAEVKKLKARLAEVEGERDSAMQRADKAEAEFQRVTLDEPVKAVLGDVFAVSLGYVMPTVNERYSFVRNEDGQIEFRTKDGEPVKLEDREADFTVSDIYDALAATGDFDDVLRASQANGSGAKGGSGQTFARNDTKTRAPIASPFGLR